MENQQTIPTLNTLTYGGRLKKVQPFMAELNPLIKNDKSMGVVGRGRKLDVFSMIHLANSKCADNVIFGNPSDLSTDREFDVVFYALQLLTMKEIARR